LVQRVLVDGVAHLVEVLAQHRLPRPLHVLLIHGRGDGDEDDDDAHHHHQLEQGEAAPAVACLSFLVSRKQVPPHHSEYLVPSSATSSDFVYTSKTFCPPQDVESGSSCMDRRPHSVLPVMGSMGMRRRKRSFLPCTSTPLTKVSRSG